jgi:hypothetical protein
LGYDFPLFASAFLLCVGGKKMRNLVLTDKHLQECVNTGCEVQVRIWGKPVETTRIVSFNQYSATLKMEENT